MQNDNKFLTIYAEESTLRLTVTGQPTLLELLRDRGIALTAPCGGDGRCGRCLVMVRGEVSAPDESERGFPGIGSEDGEGYTLRLACRTKILGDCSVKLTGNAARHKLTGSVGETFACDVPFGIAIDLGTTTVGMRAVDLQTGNTLAQSCQLNDQRVCGADVMTRIAYCDKEKGLETLHRLISCQLTRMMLQMSGGRVPEICTVAGNTVMLHLLAGIDPSPLGKAPYRSKERFGILFSPEQLDLPAAAWLLPCTGGYTGGDLTAALLALTAPVGGAEERDGLALCDLGTNGEMALLHNGHWLVTSAAAGPALEGGGISCGSGAVNGAVTAISRQEGGRYALTSEQDDTVIPIELQVMGDAEPASLTGSALVSLTALLLREGKLCPTGRMEAECWRLNDAVACTQADVRQLQLAKGAVEAAFLRLYEECSAASNGGSDNDCLHIDLHMTGGMGCRIDPADGVEIGLVPGDLGGIDIRFVPNLALEGAVLCLNGLERQRALDIAGRTRVLELTADSRFDCLFVACMRLGTPEEDYY